MDERGDASSDSVMADDLDSSRSRVTGEEIIHKTPWMQFKHLTYVDPTGKERAWDMVARSTRAPGARADAVVDDDDDDARRTARANAEEGRAIARRMPL